MEVTGNMKRNKFSLSHYKLLTCDMGELIPLSWYEALPGDTIRQSTSLLVRMTPLVAPVMHPVKVRLHSFFIPNRLLWEDWEDFITGGEDGTYTATPPHFLLNSNIATGTLFDYMDVPAADYTGLSYWISALPFRAYALIWNEIYRDQDLSNKKTISLASGQDTTTSTAILKPAWEKDYFTTARPWTSKGDEVLIPIGTTAPVVPEGTGIPSFLRGAQSTEIRVISSEDYLRMQAAASGTGTLEWEDPHLEADLSAATGISVNDLRNFLALQRFQEARAQFGSRYTEYLKYLVPGIGNLDSRLQEPEYLGGGSSIIAFSEVLQTDNNSSTDLGTLAGHGITAMRTRPFKRFFPEHGIVMTLLSVIPKSIYMQSMPKKWNRLNKESYFQKELQYIGEQPILNREVYPLHSTPDGTFGYNHRYDEYRYHPSQVAGEFRNSQNHWHYGRLFGSDPALNNSFVECYPTKRCSADQTGDCMYIMANQSIQARRILSKWSTPKTF